VYHPERRILIAGDHVLPRISPNIGADRYVADPLSDYLASLRRLRDLPVDLVLPSHGTPFDELAPRVDDIIAHHELRNDEIVRLLAAPLTTYELALRLFPLLPVELRLHAFRETRAHLAYLQRVGRAAPVAGTPERWVRAA
jgi:glyoxylase-like metal-dependent hydrolase (beta-lactamase superfamily II)